VDKIAVELIEELLLPGAATRSAAIKFDQDAAQVVHSRVVAVALIACPAAELGQDPVNCIECQVRPLAARHLVEGVGLTGMLRHCFRVVDDRM